MTRPWQAKAQVLVDRPLEAVWQAWSRLNQLTAWYAPAAAGDLTDGSQLVLSWGDLDVSIRLDVEAVQPPHHFELGANLGAGRQQQSVSLVDRGAQTLVEVTHRGGLDHFLAHGIEAGWKTQLELLRLYLEKYCGQGRGYLAEKATVEAPFDAVFAHLVSPDLTGPWLGELDAPIEARGQTVSLRAHALKFTGAVISFEEPFEIAIHFETERAVLRARQVPIDRRDGGAKMLVVELSLWGDIDPRAAALVEAVRGASSRLAARIGPSAGSA